MKLSLDFLAGAVDAAKSEMSKIVSANTVQSTKTVTVFQHNESFLVLQGNLHDKVDAPCIEFDLLYRYGTVVIQSQRIYQQEE